MTQPKKLFQVIVTAADNGDVAIELFTFDGNGNRIKGGDQYMAMNLMGEAISALSDQAKSNLLNFMKNRSKVIMDQIPLVAVLGAEASKVGGGGR